ncbi:MAG: hypothetical protein ACRC12_04595, partial [Holosporales bacterium]
MKKNTHKKVTRALIAGLFVTNLPIPMAHAGGFEEGKQTLTPPSPTSDDVSEAGAGGGETGAVAASETGEALPPISSAPSTGPAEAPPLAGNPPPPPNAFTSLGPDVQLQILRSLPLEDFLNFGSTGSVVSISDDSIKIWLEERLAGAKNFQENVQRFISLWMELRPVQGVFAERVRRVLENLTPKGHMTLEQFGACVKNMLQLKPAELWQDYDWINNKEILKLVRDLPTSLMNIFLPLSWKEVDDSNTIDILIGMSYKNQDLFKNLVSHLPPLKDWKFLISPNTYKIGLLLERVEKTDPNRFLELVSQLSPLENWDTANKVSGYLINMIEKN